MKDRLTSVEEFIPTEPSQTEIIPTLPISSINRLARTCKNLYGFFYNALLIEKLAHYIMVEPNLVEVIRMIKLDPRLLNTVIPKVFNRRGTLIRNNKPFSLAFGAGDDEMCIVLKEEMIHFYGNQEAAEAEIQSQLSEKIGEENKEQDDLIKNQLAALLTAVKQAINNEQFNLGRDADNKIILSPTTLSAICAFREGIASLQPLVIDKGMHSRVKTIKETYEAYIEAKRLWADNPNKCALFEDGVLSTVLSYAEENDAQKYNQGLYYLFEENRPNLMMGTSSQRIIINLLAYLNHSNKSPLEKFARYPTLRDSRHNFYEYIHSPSSEFSALSGSSIDIYWGKPRNLNICNATFVIESLSKLISNKDSKLEELKRMAHFQKPDSSCVIS